MKAKDFRKTAKASLKGKWGTAIITTLIASILGVFGYAAFTGSGETKLVNSITSILDNSNIPNFVWGVLAVLGVVISVWSIVKILIGGSLNLGYRRFTLNIIDSKEARIEDLFSQIKTMFGKGFILQLLTQIYTTLWCLLFIIPGIIKAYAYSMAPYILLEHPEMSANAAITESKKLMKGNKWRLFCLKLSFIGWWIVCIITLGIATLWINPYSEVSEAAFYRQISAAKAEQPAQPAQ